MAGEQNKQGVAQGTRVGMCPATPNKKGVSDAHQSPSSPRHGIPPICTYFFSPLKVNRVKSRLALQSLVMLVKYVIQESANKSSTFCSKCNFGHQV
jgi:hypothetical protein